MSISEFKHISVLLTETVESLQINPDGVYVDGTAGAGGHSEKIAEKLTGGKLLAVDRDPDAVSTLEKRFKNNKNVKIIKSNISNLNEILNNEKIDKIDGLFLDLGVSSYQLDTETRGFSYHGGEKLDMRMEKTGMTAADLINTKTAGDLAKIFYDYADEKHAYKIAKEIIKQRETAEIKTADVLTQIISKVYPAREKRSGHPSRKVFQALRIEVNDELNSLKTTLETAFTFLKSGGIISVISFHSIEDRIVKQFFAAKCKGCDCPPDFPVCICGKQPQAKLVNKKPIEPSAEEVAKNPRSRSAKLRILQKL